MVKSTYAELIEEFGTPKRILLHNLNVISPPLKCSSLKHLWSLILFGDVNKERFLEVIRLTKTKKLEEQLTSLKMKKYTLW